MRQCSSDDCDVESATATFTEAIAFEMILYILQQLVMVH